jgi:alkylation response protein AidB-like acyl-CoA dehydrogenase
MDADQVFTRVDDLARRFAAERPERQVRRHLDKQDFSGLADAGFLLTGVPAAMGGLWQDVASSTRPAAEALRTLARGDLSVALVASMHPAVLSFWLCQPEAPAPYSEVWREQTEAIARTALEGHFWGTITSESGSGGDVGKTRAVAEPAADGKYLISGAKHFGSGSGVTSYMITTALPRGEESADWFYLDVRDARWDGSGGMRLVAEWDGHGMAATQSHAFEFSGYDATRMAWPGNLRVVSGKAGAFVSALFTAVVTGVVESAVELAREQVARRRDSLRPYEQVEWARVENEAWLIGQAYEGMLRQIEARGSDALLDALHGKTAIAELAESVTGRICKIIGGGTFGRGSPFGFFFEDVRALGFLRPPWGLAFDQILERTWAAHA